MSAARTRSLPEGVRPVPCVEQGQPPRASSPTVRGARPVAGRSRKPKFREGGITLVRAGGAAGLFSAVIPGWLVKGALGTDPVTREILP